MRSTVGLRSAEESAPRWTIWTIALGSAALLVLGILGGLAVRGPLNVTAWHYLDGPARHVAVRHATPAWKMAFTDVSLLGSAVGAGLAAAIAGAWFWRRTHWLGSFVLLALAYALATFLDLATKAIVRRSPASGSVSGLLGGSFPSGHAVLASAVFGSCAWMVAHSGVRPLLRHGGVALLGLVIVGVAVARIYLLAHYASDVLGGLVLGTGAAFVVIRSIPTPAGVPYPDGGAAPSVIGPASEP